MEGKKREGQKIMKIMRQLKNTGNNKRPSDVS
jgi:hypothetical protein